MPGIKYGSTDIKQIYYGSTSIKSVYYGSTKIRPGGPRFVSKYIPQMTTNPYNGFTSSSDDLATGRQLWYPFYNSTKEQDYTFVSKSVSGQFVSSTIQLPEYIKVTKLYVSTRAGSSSTAQGPFTAIYLKGSNDGTTRTNLLYESGLKDSRGSYTTSNLKTWNISTSSYYKYLRFSGMPYYSVGCFNYWNIDGYVVSEIPDPTADILKAIQNSDTTALDSITQDGEQLSYLVKSTECTTAFIANNTLLQSYVSKMWNTVTTDTTHFQLVGNTYGDDSWTQMVTNAATADSITFFSGGYYSSTSTYGWMKHRDGTVAKIGNKGGKQPKSVTTSNVEGVSFVGATFGQCGSSTDTTKSGDGYAAGATYKVL